MQHHKGNSDRQDEKGDTIDWLSIYRHGHHGEAENPWSYVFLSFFRDDVGAIRKELHKRKNGDLFWGNLELGAFAITLFVMFLFNWRYVIFYFLPFWYLGHCFSYLNGYYRHYGANPDKPIAWGVSSYGKIYNWLFFYNGYHAEHHFRPKVHWTKMEKFHQSIEGLQKQEGVRTIKRAHMLGFLDPDLPKRGESDPDECSGVCVKRRIQIASLGGRRGECPYNDLAKLLRNFSFFASHSSCNRRISEASCFSSDCTSSRFPAVCALRI